MFASLLSGTSVHVSQLNDTAGWAPGSMQRHVEFQLVLKIQSSRSTSEMSRLGWNVSTRGKML